MPTIQEILARQRKQSHIDVQALSKFIYTPPVSTEMQNLKQYKFGQHDFNIFNKSRVDLIKKSIQEYKGYLGNDRTERDKRYILPYLLRAHLQWPMTIHTSMFLTCIEMLGTHVQQTQWFKKAFDLEIFGCYVQTQLGHGSDVQNLQTTATYVLENDTFIINTPTISATKFWPGDLGIFATHAIVFAQLIIQGKNHGVHSFLVPVRDTQTFQLLPGIQAGDIGPKFGFHSKDNGFLIMNNIVIPKRNMLRRFVSVSKTGQIKVKGDPKVSYATMMSIRQTISCTMPRIYGQAITIAARYSLFRTQFLSSDQVEIPIIDYQTQKDKIITRIAEYIAVSIGGTAVKDVSDRNLVLVKQKNDFSLMGQSHVCLCLGKALFTQIAYDGIEICRKSCGGHGFSHYSGLPSLITEYASNLTLQGENTILYMQVTRYLLKHYKYAMTKKKNVGESVQYLLQCNQYIQKRIDPNRYDWKTWTLDDIHTLLAQAACYTLSLVTQKMINKPEGMSNLDVWNTVAGCDISRAGKCHALFYTFNYFKKALDKETNSSNKEVIKNLCMLFGASVILQHSAPIIEGGFIIADQLSALGRLKQILLQKIRPHMVNIIDAFSIPEQFIQSALTHGDPYQNYLDLARKCEINSKIQESALIIRKNIQQAVLKHQAKL